MAVSLLSVGLQMPVWSSLIRRTLPRVESVIAREPGQSNVRVLSADVLEYRDYYRDFPTRLVDLRGPRIDIEFYKRPAYGLISGFLTVVVQALTESAYPDTMFLVLAFYASLAITLLGLLAIRLGLHWLEALLVAVLGAFSFSWLALFSVPESYSLSVCAALLVLHSGIGLAGSRADAITPRLLQHVVVTVLASWVYIPLCGGVLMLVDGIRGRRQWLTVLAPCMVLAVLGMALPHLIRGSDAIATQVVYAERWSTPAHFADIGVLLRVALGLLWFGIVAPVSDFVYAAPTVSPVLILGRWQSVLGAVALTVCYGWLVRSSRTANRAPITGAVLWFVSLYVFHVFFNPGEVLLHVPVPTAVLLYLLAAHVPQGGSAPRGRAPVVLSLLTLVAILAFTNLGAVLGT